MRNTTFFTSCVKNLSLVSLQHNLPLKQRSPGEQQINSQGIHRTLAKRFHKPGKEFQRYHEIQKFLNKLLVTSTGNSSASLQWTWFSPSLPHLCHTNPDVLLPKKTNPSAFPPEGRSLPCSEGRPPSSGTLFFQRAMHISLQVSLHRELQQPLRAPV